MPAWNSACTDGELDWADSAPSASPPADCLWAKASTPELLYCSAAAIGISSSGAGRHGGEAPG